MSQYFKDDILSPTTNDLNTIIKQYTVSGDAISAFDYVKFEGNNVIKTTIDSEAQGSAIGSGSSGAVIKCYDWRYNLSVGALIKFGDENWYVINRTDDDLFLLHENALTTSKFSDTAILGQNNYSASLIKTYLDTQYNILFSARERYSIKESNINYLYSESTTSLITGTMNAYMFLPSIDEFNMYIKDKSFTEGASGEIWWLRDGVLPYNVNAISDSLISYNGYLPTTINSVRPCLHIDPKYVYLEDDNGVVTLKGCGGIPKYEWEYASDWNYFVDIDSTKITNYSGEIINIPNTTVYDYSKLELLGNTVVTPTNPSLPISPSNVATFKSVGNPTGGSITGVCNVYSGGTNFGGIEFCRYITTLGGIVTDNTKIINDNGVNVLQLSFNTGRQPFYYGFKPNTQYRFKFRYKQNQIPAGCGALVLIYTDGTGHNLFQETAVNNSTEWVDYDIISSPNKSIKCILLSSANGKSYIGYYDADTFSITEYDETIKDTYGRVNSLTLKDDYRTLLEMCSINNGTTIIRNELFSDSDKNGYWKIRQNIRKVKVTGTSITLADAKPNSYYHCTQSRSKNLVGTTATFDSAVTNAEILYQINSPYIINLHSDTQIQLKSLPRLYNGDTVMYGIDEVAPSFSLDYLHGNINVILTKYKGDAPKVVVPTNIQTPYVNGFTVFKNPFQSSTQKNYITSVDFGDNVGVRYNPLDHAFENMSSLIVVNNLPNDVRTMYYTFQNCYNLKYVSNIPKMAEILLGCFKGCSKLECVPYIPNTVETMGSCFEGCISLKNITNIPTKAENLIQTFLNCQSLKTIPDIPRKVTSMYNCFKGCVNLQGVINILAKQINDARGCFDNTILPITLRMFKGYYTDYTFKAQLPNWSNVTFNDNAPTKYDTAFLYGSQYVDYLHIINQEKEPTATELAYTYKPKWNANTLLLANFDDNINGGNVNVEEDIVNWIVYRKDEDSNILKYIDKVTVTQLSVIDYTVGTQSKYTYIVFPETSETIGSQILSDEITTTWGNWSLTDIDLVDKEQHLYKADVNNIWFFDLNLTSSDLTQNVDKYIYNGFAQFPKTSVGKRNYMSGTVTALLGKFVDYVYTDTKKMQEDFRACVINGKPKLLKDRKGNVYIVDTMSNSFKYMDNVGIQPTIVSFDFVQIGDAEKITVVE